MAESTEDLGPAVIRRADASDHGAFCALFPELGVDDPTPSPERFAAEIAPRMLLAERPAGRVVGYALYDVLEGLAYVRHLVTGHETRRSGIGRALLRAVADDAVARGATRWVLNVKPDNVAAIALYASLGFRPTYRVHAVHLAWQDALTAARAAPADVEISPLGPGADGEVEAAMTLLPGHLGATRALGGRTMLVARDRASGAIAGVSVYDPGFPSTYPFKASSPAVAFALLAATRPHAPADHDGVHMKLDDLEAVKDAVLAAGGRLRLEVVNLEAPLPLP